MRLKTGEEGYWKQEDCTKFRNLHSINRPKFPLKWRNRSHILHFDPMPKIAIYTSNFTISFLHPRNANVQMPLGDRRVAGLFVLIAEEKLE